MKYARRSGGQITLFVLAVIGLAISVYLTIVHYNTGVQLYCSGSGLVNCERVTTSQFSHVPGLSAIPITIPGMLWFAVSGVLAFAAWRIWPELRSLLITEVVWSALGMVTILYLIYAEIVVLHAICAWCTALHVIIFLGFLIAVTLLLQQEDDELLEEEEEIVPEIPTKGR